MQRFRRNPLFAPRVPRPEPGPGPENWSIAGLTVIGIVANPKTNEPALVVTDGEFVSLRGLKASNPLQRLGRGYYEERTNDPARITGFPRSHTPDGVLVKGKGWGTSLYTALALGAHQTEEDLVEIAMYKPSNGTGNGISSWTNDRSAEADKWWAVALEMGLADKETEEETEREEDVDLNVDPDDLDKFVDEGSVVYVNSVNVDIEKTTEVVVESYAYSEASDRRHLVCAAMNIEIPKGLDVPSALGFLWRQVQEDSDWVSEADPYGLLALDVRGLHRDAFNLLSLCFGEAGLDDAARDGLVVRFEQGLDPQATGRQGQLFAKNGLDLSDVLLAREAGGWEDLAELP